VLDHQGAVLVDGVGDFAVAVVAVDSSAQGVAGGDVLRVAERTA
jgi:hypothetical protein